MNELHINEDTLKAILDLHCNESLLAAINYAIDKAYTVGYNRGYARGYDIGRDVLY